MNRNMETIIARYRAYLFVSGFSKQTIRHRVGTVRRLDGAGVNLMTATSADLICYLSEFECAATRASYRAAICSFYHWAVTFGELANDPSAKIPKVKVPRTLPRPISDEGLAAVISATHGDVQAVVILMAYCGLRGSEACAVTPDDFQLSGGSWRLRVTNPKGGGEQVVAVPTWVAEQVRERFPTRYQYGTTMRIVSNIIQLIEPTATPHSLRHWYATTALRQCSNVRVVQEMLRHKSLASTQIYTLVTESDSSAVAELLPHVA